MSKELEKSIENTVSRAVTPYVESDGYKKACEELGSATQVLATLVNNSLLPIAAINFGFEKARIYFSERFESDIGEKINKIDKRKIIEPKASVVGPVLQGLAFSHEENELKEMYLNLLASAMNMDKTQSVHPSFVEIIKQLTPYEAKELKYLLNETNSPIVQLTFILKDRGFRIFKKHILDLVDEETQKPVIENKYPTYIENWIRLGLIKVDYTVYLVNDDVYSYIKDRPEYKQAEEMVRNNDDFKRLEIEKGKIEITSYGKEFYRICVS